MTEATNHAGWCVQIFTPIREGKIGWEQIGRVFSTREAAVKCLDQMVIAFPESTELRLYEVLKDNQ